MRFLGFFRFVSKKFCLFRLFRYLSETPKQTETNGKNFFGVSRNKPKNNRNRLSFGLFRFEPKKNFDRFEDTLTLSLLAYSQSVTLKSNNESNIPKAVTNKSDNCSNIPKAKT